LKRGNFNDILNSALSKIIDDYDNNTTKLIFEEMTVLMTIVSLANLIIMLEDLKNMM
jgi:hypothetical protein